MKTVIDLVENLDELSKCKSLDIRNISKKGFLNIPKLEDCVQLKICGIKTDSLAGLSELKKLEELSLEWATKITKINEIENLKNLRRLRISDFKKLLNVEPIASLTNLIELELSGGIWNVLKLESLLPMCGLLNLQKLTLANIKLLDDDIKKIVTLPKLNDLFISNQFPREQFAYLAKRLNHKLKTKIEPYKSALECEICGERKFMFTGRRMPFLCKECDEVRFEKLNKEFFELENKIQIV